MMKKNKFLLLILCSILLLNACEKNNETPKPEPQGLNLVGKWQVKEINFTSNVKPWHSETIQSTVEVFGWAPFMYGSVLGMEFTNTPHKDEKTSKEGKVLNLVTNSPHGSSGVFWVWNLLDEGKSFEIAQLNKAMPPHDFSLTKVTGLKEATANGKRLLTFTTTLSSLDQDKLDDSTNPMSRAKLQAAATFILEEVKGEIDANAQTVLKLNGEALKLPESAKKPEVTAAYLKGSAWVLQKGSKIYDPGFNEDAERVYEFTKLVTLNFVSESALKFRYTFPMGIVSEKEAVWSFDEKSRVLSYVKAGGGFAGSSMKFSWNVSAFEYSKSKELILEIREIIDKFGEQSPESLDLNKVDDALKQRVFLSAAPKDTQDDEVVKKEDYEVFN